MVGRSAADKPHGSSNSACSTKQSSSNHEDLLQHKGLALIELLVLPVLRAGGRYSGLQTIRRQRVVLRVRNHVLASSWSNRFPLRTGLRDGASASHPAL